MVSMTSRRFNRKPPPLELCAEPDADDGIDPRYLPRYPAGKVSNRKALQLCRQVAHALGLALAGDVLRDLLVQSVLPAPDSSRLLVTFVYHGSSVISSQAILEILESQRARFRCAVAEAIHRKKTPDLTFHVILAN
jgi:ribosome-binding factor A